MYERDQVHTTATKNNDPALYGGYKRLRNQVTAMINANKKEYYKHVDALSKSDPKQKCGVKSSNWWHINQSINSGYVI